MVSPVSFDSADVVVGRKRERETLRACFERARRGRGGLALLSGDAGIGKTTLVHDIARVAAGSGALVLSGHCYDLATTPPYGPWIEIVRASPRVDGLPSLNQILSGQGNDGLNPGRGDELFAWGLELFGKLAGDRPLLLILEDLHWADRASLDFLRYLGRAVAGIPALVVATYRADEVIPGHQLYTLLPAIVRESQPERIDLHPLDADATLAWVGARYELSPGDARRLAGYLQRSAEGNPFFTGEILRELEESGLLTRAGDAWRLADLSAAGMPPLLRQVLEQRLSRILSETREALALAAVIGQEVEIELWQGLARLSDDAVLVALDRAQRAALIDLSSDGTRLAFRHALIRQALYEEILPPGRRLLHRQVADRLIERGHPDPDAVAYHLQRAGDARAGQWLIAAGHRAYYQAYSLQTAQSRYEAALAALPDDALEERGWLLAQLAQTVRYLDPWKGLEYADEAVAIAEELGNRPLAALATRNRGVCRVYGGQSALGDMLNAFDMLARLDDEETRVLRGRRQGRDIDTRLGRHQMALWYAAAGRYQEALAASQRAFAGLDVDASNNAAHAAILHWGAAFTFASLGEPERASAAFRRSRDVYRATGQDFHAQTATAWEFTYVTLPYSTDKLDYRDGQAQELLAFGQNDLSRVTNDPPDVFLCPLYLIEGRWNELRRFEEESRLQSRSVFFPFLCLPALAEYHRRAGSGDEARGYIETCFPDGPDVAPEDARYRYAEALDVQRLAADLALDQGDLDAASVWINARRRWLDWSGRVPGRAEQATLEARLLRLQDEPEQARPRALEALRLAEEPRQPLALLSALRTFAEISLVVDERDAAGGALERAIALAETCRAPYDRAVSQLLLAEVRLAAGRHDDARRALAGAKRDLEALGAEPALARLEALQRRLRSPSRAATDPVAGLSAREVEVLNLVARGLTDREIGAQLFISPRTVSQHMRSIFNKLAVNSRTAAALRGAELGLLQPTDA